MKITEIITETTSAGGIATVVSGAGAPAFTRGASVYGQKKSGPRKKKKSGKYANSITESAGDNKNILIELPEVNVRITYDDRPGIRSWFLAAYMQTGSANSYIFTKDNKFTREIPIELVSFADYKRFKSSDEAIRALKNSNFYKAVTQEN